MKKPSSYVWFVGRARFEWMIWRINNESDQETMKVLSDISSNDCVFGAYAWRMLAGVISVSRSRIKATIRFTGFNSTPERNICHSFSIGGIPCEPQPIRGYSAPRTLVESPEREACEKGKCFKEVILWTPYLSESTPDRPANL